MAYVALATLVLLLPLAAESVRVFTLGGDEKHRLKLWIQHCHANQVLCVVVVSLWCGFGEFLISKPIFVFWLVPSVIMAAARAIRLAISKNALGARWTTTDCLRIVFGRPSLRRHLFSWPRAQFTTYWHERACFGSRWQE